MIEALLALDDTIRCAVLSPLDGGCLEDLLFNLSPKNCTIGSVSTPDDT